MRLIRREGNPVFLENRELFFKIISAAMAKRRKTLLNSLANSDFCLPKEEWRALFALSGLEESRRGESLSMEEFAALANAASNKLK